MPTLYSPDGFLVKTLRGHRAHVRGIAFSPDSSLLTSASWDVKLWFPEGKLITTLRGHHGRVRDLSISRDETLLASVGEDKRLLLWNPGVNRLNGDRSQNEPIQPDYWFRFCAEGL